MTGASEAPLVIAIDGPAGAGKSTVGRALAERLGLEYLDTGAMYRAVTFAALRRNIDPADDEPVAALVRRVDLAVTDSAGNVLVQLTPSPVKTSGDWAALCYDVAVATWGTGDEFLTARWTFAKFVSGGLALNDGSKLVCTVNDDMRGLVSHRITAQGYRSFEDY